MRVFDKQIRVLILLLALATPLAAQRAIRINLGTVVPRDSAWHEVLMQIRQDWKKISGGRVDLRIYAGGSLGDEAEMLRKVRIGQLQAVATTSIGLAIIDQGVDALSIPMLCESYAELDYVRDGLAPQLEKRLEDKGYVVLNWSDGGWAQFFSKEPAKTLDDIRNMKLWISAGDPRTERLYKDFDMNVVPLPLTETATALQTGLVEAITEPPLFALLEGTYKRAAYMTDIKWGPVVGGTVISSKAWARIPADMRPKLLASAEKAGESLRKRIRALGEDAIDEMRQRGLTVVEADRGVWLKEVEEAYPRLRGVLAPAELFDEAIRLRDRYRSR